MTSPASSREEKIAEAARRLIEADRVRCETSSIVVRLRNATDIGRACWLAIPCPGSANNPNPIVKEIIAAADALAGEARA